MLRFAAPGDAEQVLFIYQPYIEKTTITFETEVPSLEAFRSRMQSIMQTYPYLVWEEQGEILGYAYAHAFAPRQAYRHCCEVSVYVREGHTHRGIGRRLYAALFKLLEEMGILSCFALICVPNEPSVKLCEYFSFSLVCTLRKVGYKRGKFLDVAYYRRDFGGLCTAPQLRGIQEIPDAVCGAALEQYSV